MSVEIRYIGNRTAGIPININYNEQDIYNAGFGSSSSFVDEFKKAQQNLAANVAAGKGATFAYTGIPGTSPLPIFLASYTGLGAAAAGDPNELHRQPVDQHRDHAVAVAAPAQHQRRSRSTNATNGLFGNATFRANGIAAGMPANFWVLNPDVASDIVRTGDGFDAVPHDPVPREPAARQGSDLQRATTPIRCRPTRSSTRSSASWRCCARPHPRRQLLGRERTSPSCPPPHAFKMTANYELPFGRDHRFGSNMNGLAQRHRRQLAGQHDRPASRPAA